MKIAFLKFLFSFFLLTLLTCFTFLFAGKIEAAPVTFEGQWKTTANTTITNVQASDDDKRYEKDYTFLGYGCGVTHGDTIGVELTTCNSLSGHYYYKGPEIEDLGPFGSTRAFILTNTKGGGTGKVQNITPTGDAKETWEIKIEKADLTETIDPNGCTEITLNVKVISSKNNAAQNIDGFKLKASEKNGCQKTDQAFQSAGIGRYTLKTLARNEGEDREFLMTTNGNLSPAKVFVKGTGGIQSVQIQFNDAEVQCGVGWWAAVANVVTFNFGCALLGAVTTLAGWLDNTVTYFSSLVEKSINSENIATPIIKDAWLLIRNLSLSILAIGVIIIAFANVLSIDIKTYGVQAMIPKLVIAIVLTYFSFFIAELLIDFAGVLTTQLHETMKTLTGSDLAIKEYAITNSIANLPTALILLLAIIFMLAALIYLAIVLLARVVVLNLLIIIAPMAFILGIMPFTSFLEKQWWENFTKWVFMGPAIMFMLLVGNVIITSISQTPPVIPNDVKVGSGDSIFIVLTAAIAYFLAVQLPMSMGHKALDVAGKVRGAGAFGLKKTGVSGMWEQRKDAGKVADTRRATALRARIGGGKDGSKAGSRIRRWAGGYESQIEAETAKTRMDKARVSDLEKRYEDLDTDTMKNRIMDPKLHKHDQLAIMRVLASRPGGIQASLRDEDGNLVSEDKQQLYRRQEQLVNENIKDVKLMGHMFKTQSEAMMNYNTPLRDVAINGAKKPYEIETKNLKALISAASEGNTAARGVFEKYNVDTIKNMKMMNPGAYDYLSSNHEGLPLNHQVVEILQGIEHAVEHPPEDNGHQGGGQNPPGGGQNPQPPPPGNPPHQA